MQEISPSRTGWWEFFQVSARTCWWQVAHCSLAEAALSCASGDFGAWTEWQVMQERPRLACTLPSQWNCDLPSWQLWQIATCALVGSLSARGCSATLSGSSTCRLPGP